MLLQRCSRSWHCCPKNAVVNKLFGSVLPVSSNYRQCSARNPSKNVIYSATMLHYCTRVGKKPFCKTFPERKSLYSTSTQNETEEINRDFSTETFPEESEVSRPHIPVMLNVVIEGIKPESGQTIIDMTFGAGGHTKKLLEKAENVKIFALDRDETAHNYAKELQVQYPDKIVPLLGKFSDLPKLLKEHNVKQNSIDAILFDYGCSSMQFDVAERGFSIARNGPLDMRMDLNSDTPTAADVIAHLAEEELYRIIKYYGEEKQARKIAAAIVETRSKFKRFETTGELADLVESVCDGEMRLDKLQRRSHPATKTFQALRIFVNNELNEINQGLVVSRHFLKLGGRLVTLTFHSLEDTIVKRHIHGNLIEDMANPLPLKYSSSTLQIDKEIVETAIDPHWRMLHKHVLIPKYEEMESNPRCRSAKLRIAVRIK